MSTRYIVDERGERIEAVLPIEEYERLLEAFEELEDARIHDEAMAEMRGSEADAKPRPLEEVAAEIERKAPSGGSPEENS